MMETNLESFSRLGIKGRGTITKQRKGEGLFQNENNLKGLFENYPFF